MSFLFFEPYEPPAQSQFAENIPSPLSAEVVATGMDPQNAPLRLAIQKFAEAEAEIETRPRTPAEQAGLPLSQRFGRIPLPPIEKLQPETLNQRYGHLGLKFTKPMSAAKAKVRADYHLQQYIRQDVIARGQGGIVASAAGLGLGFAYAAVDPINLAAILVPGAGAVRAAKITEQFAARFGAGTVRQRLALGATEGFIGTAAIEPVVAKLSESLQLDYTATDALINLTFGTVLGAGLRSIGGAIGDRLAGMTPAERDLAQRTAVAQAAADRTPDVEPILARAADERAPARVDLDVEAPPVRRALEDLGVPARVIDDVEGLTGRSVDALTADIEAMVVRTPEGEIDAVRTAEALVEASRVAVREAARADLIAQRQAEGYVVVPEGMDVPRDLDRISGEDMPDMVRTRARESRPTREDFDTDEDFRKALDEFEDRDQAATAAEAFVDDLRARQAAEQPAPRPAEIPDADRPAPLTDQEIADLESRPERDAVADFEASKRAAEELEDIPDEWEVDAAKAEADFQEQLLVEATAPEPRHVIVSEPGSGNKPVEVTEGLIAPLVQNHESYFTITDDAVIIPIEDIAPIRARANGIANARMYMRSAAAAARPGRQPISVKDVGGGKYELLDGNSTYAVAKASGWSDIPARVLTDEQFAAEEAAKDAAKAAMPPQPGAIMEFPPEMFDISYSDFMAGQFGRTMDQVYQHAAPAQLRLNKVGVDIEEALGVKFSRAGGDDPTQIGLKKRAKSEEKMVRYELRDAGELNDVVRAGFLADSAEQVEPIIQMLRAQFDIFDGGYRLTKEGYFDRKVLIRFDDMTVGEVQIWEPNLFNYKTFDGDPGRPGGGRSGHDLYEEWRVLPKKQPPGWDARRKELSEQMVALYSEALSKAEPSWAGKINEVKSSGTSIGPKILMKSSLLIHDALWPTSAGLVGSQPSPLINTAARQGSSVETAGRPSHSKKSMSSPSEESISKGLHTVNNKIALGLPESGVEPSLSPSHAARPAAAQGVEQVMWNDRPVEFRYEVVDASELVPSHFADGIPNEAYDLGDVQNRDRSTAASISQMQNIAANPRMNLLGRSNKMNEGATLVDGRGRGIDGNGRLAGIIEMYRRHPENARAYREYLREQGFDVPEAGPRPILIKRLLTELNDSELVEFGADSNVSQALTKSQSEVAGIDSRRMTPALIDLYRGGEINSAANRDFVREFVNVVVPGSEQQGFLTRSGGVSQDGLRRIENAMFARAFEDVEVVRALREDSSENFRNIGNAMIRAAPEWAKMRVAAKDGSISAELDITDDLMTVLSLVRRSRADRQPLIDMLAQTDLVSGGATPLQQGLARLMFNTDNYTSPTSMQRLADNLDLYAREAQKAAPTGLLDDLPPVDPGGILAQVLERHIYGQDTLFLKSDLDPQMKAVNDKRREFIAAVRKAGSCMGVAA